MVFLKFIRVTTGYNAIFLRVVNRAIKTLSRPYASETRVCTHTTTAILYSMWKSSRAIYRTERTSLNPVRTLRAVIDFYVTAKKYANGNGNGRGAVS